MPDADNETAMVALRRIVKRARFVRIEVTPAGAAVVMGFPLKLIDITDAEAELLARLRAE